MNEHKLFSVRGVFGAAVVLAFLALFQFPAQAQSVTASTNPPSGFAGVDDSYVTGAGFPGGAITDATVVFGASCASPAIATAPVIQVAVAATLRRFEFLIPSTLTTGTYFVWVTGTAGSADFNTSNTPSCSQIMVMNPLPCLADTICFGQTETGTISSVAQSNRYTFSANANDVVDFTIVATSGNLDPKILVYGPAEAQIGIAYNAFEGGCVGGPVELNTVAIPTTGTYTVLISDCGDTNTGNYTIYTQRTNNPAGPVGLLFGQVQTNTITSAAQSNTYTFSASANDVVDFTIVTTTGSLDPKIRVYNPAGKQLDIGYNAFEGGCVGGPVELNTVAIPTTGTYTVLIGDCGDTNTGNYTIYTQRTNNPAGPVGLLFGQVQTGAIGSAALSNTYTFSASASDVVDFTIVATSGTLNPKIRVYNPAGTQIDIGYNAFEGGCVGGPVKLNAAALPTTGTYTVLVGDCGDTNTGNYNLSSQCFGVCTAP